MSHPVAVVLRGGGFMVLGGGDRPCVHPVRTGRRATRRLRCSGCEPGCTAPLRCARPCWALASSPGYVGHGLPAQELGAASRHGQAGFSTGKQSHHCGCSQISRLCQIFKMWLFWVHPQEQLKQRETIMRYIVSPIFLLYPPPPLHKHPPCASTKGGASGRHMSHFAHLPSFLPGCASTEGVTCHKRGACAWGGVWSDSYLQVFPLSVCRTE